MINNNTLQLEIYNIDLQLIDLYYAWNIRENLEEDNILILREIRRLEHYRKNILIHHPELELYAV